AYELADGGGVAGAPRSIAFELASADALPPTTIPAGLVPAPWDLAAICGTAHVVSTRAEFDAALPELQPGDGILITEGSRDWGEITIPESVRGTAERPIVIRSHDGPVIFTGATVLRVAGSHVHVQGLSVDEGSGGWRVDGSASALPTGVRFSLMHCREMSGQCLYVGRSTLARFDHSLIERSRTKSVHVSNQSTLARIDHNHLRDIETRVIDGTVVNGGEAIQLGHGLPGTIEDVPIVPMRALVDHNVLQRTEGEGEMIGVKTGGNIVALNVVVDATYGHISLRGGEHNLVFGNVIRATRAGVRMHGIAPVVVHNLIVDPHTWEGIRIPTGSDRLWQPEGYDVMYVRYVAARRGLVRNNTVVLTSRGETSARAFAMNAQDDFCGGPCDVVPFDNDFVRNLFVNARGGATVGYPQAFVDANSFEENGYWLAGGATLGVEGSVAASVSLTSEELQAPHAALAERVWAAPADECLRLERAAELDAVQGVLFGAGACERPGEDTGVLLFAIDLLADPSAAERLVSWLGEQPPMVVPRVPPPR
nr:hypothetical protein [Myxococcota bacterium]